MEIWVLFAVLAAATQALRTAVQRRMVAPLGSYGAAYIRFSYACPFAWLCVYTYVTTSGEALAGLTPTFWAWINIAALTQVIFTVLTPLENGSALSFAVVWLNAQSEK